MSKKSHRSRSLRRLVMWCRREWSIFKGYWDWRIIYPDGSSTYRLTWTEAESLRENFGGSIKYDPPNNYKADRRISDGSTQAGRGDAGVGREGKNETESADVHSRAWLSAGWVSTAVRLPEDKVPVLAVVNGAYRLAMIRTEKPGWEDTFRKYRYWDTPEGDGMEWTHEDVTHWLPLPRRPEPTRTTSERSAS